MQLKQILTAFGVSEVAIQILIVFVGGAAFQVTRIGGREWGISLALGFVSIPLGALLRLIPNEPVERFFIKIHLMPNPEVLPTARPNVEWNSAIDLVRDNLATFSHVRGARMRASSYVGKSRKGKAQRPVPAHRVFRFATVADVRTADGDREPHVQRDRHWHVFPSADALGQPGRTSVLLPWREGGGNIIYPHQHVRDTK